MEELNVNEGTRHPEKMAGVANSMDESPPGVDLGALLHVCDSEWCWAGASFGWVRRDHVRIAVPNDPADEIVE